MSDESSLWTTVREKLGPYGILCRVENRVGPGMPDVHYLLKRSPRVVAVAGWLELKYEPAWPKHDHTAVILSTLTLEQVTWIEDYKRLGGRAFALLQIETSYLLISPLALRAVFERELTCRQLRGYALAYGHRTLPTAEVIKCLTAP